MIRLYQFATSPFTEKVVRALHFKRLDYEVVEVARAKVPEGDYADVSPTGKFPAIVDGTTNVWDSTDILHHIESVYPEPSLTPSSKRDAGLAHAIEDWADESLYFYEMTLRLSWEHNLEKKLDDFAKTMPGVPREQVKTLVLEGVGQLTKAQGIGRKPREQIVADVQRHFEALDGMLDGRDWLVGEQISYADLAVIGQVNALLDADEGEAGLASTKFIKAWMDRVDEVAPKEKQA